MEMGMTENGQQSIVAEPADYEASMTKSESMKENNDIEQEEDHVNKGNKEGVEPLSIEMIFKDQKVLPWQRQLTLRAFVVSLVLSVLFSVIVMKLILTSGVIPSLNVSAGLLGFFFVKTWTKLLERSGWLRQPFTRQENTVIQTCVVAASGIAYSDFLYDDYPEQPPIQYHNRDALTGVLMCPVKEALGATSLG